MGDTGQFRCQPDGERLSTAVVRTVARAHDEDVSEQRWPIAEDADRDALDGLFQRRKLDTILPVEADTTTVTVDADASGRPLVGVEAHR